ncbi:ABC transporter ATP-binding protein [Trichlorobacter ammonificans]|uniref:Murein tripeptide ABC transporter/oligopeptide ABC transporter ATP binding subunit OppF n=1 Tax=Trichlorobacter ammonificans TaxID=2916410 RepID=A0ABN8HFM5_9BACT|nr:ABC transporter ATP-binding protein [Trichlorobacter ammonificans]CAH2031650.1 murein tripeptide ABC transporter/oligopeptide ABC transporter ATP binding subunit OppF [Trichlorobacter ammonificans]
MKRSMLRAEDVSKRYVLKDAVGRKAVLTAVDRVSLTVEEGETLGIAGESGCGKSTLARIMAGLLAADAGSVSFEGVALADLGPEGQRQFRRAVQMVFQDPFSSLNPRLRIGDAIAEPIHIHGLAPRAALRDATTALMAQVGLSADQYDRFPHEFSGGQRQRIGIARALAAQPRLLLADEPVSSLDISIQAQIINLLQELKHRHGLTMAMISHDLGVLRHVSDRIAVMYLGAVVEVAPTPELFTSSRHPYTRLLLSAIPRIRREREAALTEPPGGDPPSPTALPSGCRFHPRCPHAAERCRVEAPLLTDQGPGHRAACHFASSLF